MCIQRSVLNHYILRHTNTERGEVPHSLDAARNHSIRNLLGYLNGDRQHTDINIVLAHLLFKIIGMENRNTVQCRTHQIRINIECRHNLQAEMTQTGIAQQRTAQTSDTEKKSLVYIGKSQKVLQHSNQRIYIIPHTRAAGNIDIRQILCYLRSINIDFFGDLSGGNKAFTSLSKQLYIGKIPRKPARVGSGTFMESFFCS